MDGTRDRLSKHVSVNDAERPVVEKGNLRRQARGNAQVIMHAGCQLVSLTSNGELVAASLDVASEPTAPESDEFVQVLHRAIEMLPPLPSGGFNGGLSSGAPLSIIYQGEKVGITKDRFVIGRGKQSSDLTLKDPNVSRQHAMIEFQNGVYYMVDLGSTNGVEYQGQRVTRKAIMEGDVFRICDHELRFTYR